MASIHELIKKHGIRMSATRGAYQPPPDVWDCDGWTVTLRIGRKSLSTPFLMGKGCLGCDPTIYDVLSSLLSDASSAESANDFEDWCACFGSNPDSIRELKTFKACKRVSKRLRQFLGDLYEDFARSEDR